MKKKVAALLDFVQMREGGGPCPNFLSTNCILGQFGDGEGGGGCPIFWHIGVQKKWYKLSKLGGGGEGGQGNLDKIQKNSYFFFVKPSLSDESLITNSQI